MELVLVRSKRQQSYSIFMLFFLSLCKSKLKQQIMKSNRESSIHDTFILFVQ